MKQFNGCLMAMVDSKNLPSIDINEDDLYTKEEGYGIEENPHVTLLYGLDQNINIDKIKEFISSNIFSKIPIKLQGITFFENEEYDVLKWDVESIPCMEINSLLKKNFSYQNDYPEYHPHITIAYLKKGKALNYTSLTQKNEILYSNKLIYSVDDKEEAFKISSLKESVESLLINYYSKEIFETNLFPSYQEFINEERSEKEKWDIWSEWKTWINMSASELKKFKESEEGKKAGLTQKEADKQGIDSGRESASWLLKMIPKGKTFEQAKKNWTSDMWRWAGKQNSFNARMYGMRKRAKGDPWKEENGEKSRLLLSLLIWGFDPRKGKNGKPKKPTNLEE